jgi:hypothetical protein
MFSKKTTFQKLQERSAAALSVFQVARKSLMDTIQEAVGEIDLLYAIRAEAEARFRRVEEEAAAEQKMLLDLIAKNEAALSNINDILGEE